MARILRYLNVAAGALLLAATASSTAGTRAGTPGPQTQTTQAWAYSVLVVPAAPGAKPAIEHLPKSQLAWEFSTLPDGTKVISGPNGMIWRGHLEAGMGPINPPSATQNNPAYRLYLSPSTPGQKPFYEIVPPTGKWSPGTPNMAPFLPPGQSQPRIIQPKIVP